MSTSWSWSSSADGTFSYTIGTAPSVTSGGTYGSRWVWASSTSQAYGMHSGISPTLTNIGCRFIYSVGSFATSSHSVHQAMSTGSVQEYKVDLDTSGHIRLRSTGSPGTLIATSTGALSAATEYRFEVYRTSGGAATVNAYTLGGSLVATVTGTVGAGAIERVAFGNTATLSGTLGQQTVDEIVLTNTAAEVGAVSGGSGAVTYFTWSNTGDSWDTTVGTTPTYPSGGSYGVRTSWASTTAAAYATANMSSVTTFGCRFIYSVASFGSATHSVWQGQSTGGAQEAKVDINVSQHVVIRDTTTTIVGTGTATLSAATEYRFEIYRNGTTLTVKVYAGTGTTLIDTITGTVGSGTITKMVFGNNATGFGTLGVFTIDEVIVNDSGAVIGAATPTGGTDTINAGTDFTTEPGIPIVLTATSSGTNCTWSQVSGTTAAPGSTTGLTATVPRAPMNMSGASMVYRATAANGGATDDVTVTVLPATEAIWVGGVLTPVLMVTT